jgi:capsular polysaccharide biosynthesis protein
MNDQLNQESLKKELNSVNLLHLLYKWRLTLVIITSVAIVAAIIFSSPLFIKPKFKSSVIMFPVATNSISKVLISPNSGIKEDILGIGEEEQAEQMLQMLNSNMIRDRIIEKYKLLEHYKIPAGSKHKYTRLHREYENNVKFRRTEYMAVKITVFDTDPQTAADMANDIAALLDSTRNFMQKERAVKAFQIVNEEYRSLENEVTGIVDALKYLGSKGVNDYERQSEVLNQQLAIAISQNNQNAMRALQQKLDTVGKYGGEFLSLKNALEFKTEQLTLLKTKYQEAKVDAEQFLPQKFIVNSAYKAEIKSYPIRWIILIVTAFIVFFTAVLTIIIVENYTKLQLKKNFGSQ